MINEIKKTSKLNFDIALASPDMMKELAPIAKTLGTKGLMPNPKNETVTADPVKMVKALQTGKVSFRSDVTGNIHQVIGKTSFPVDQLKGNFETLMDAIRKAKPSESKGTYIQNVVVTTSMGPAIKVAL
jgi:large subunit ribosomal protein L1